MFEILKKDPKSKARLGLLSTPHGVINTPAFMPIGTKGAVKALTSDELVDVGAEVILANTYHLWISGDEIISGDHFYFFPNPLSGFENFRGYFVFAQYNLS